MKIDHVIDSVKNSVPECLAAGAVDLATGMFLSVRAGDEQRAVDLDLLAATAGELFHGEAIASVARAFSDDEDGAPREVVITSGGAVCVFQRCRRRPGVAVVTVSRASANLGAVLAGARRCLAAVESTLAVSIAPPAA